MPARRDSHSTLAGACVLALTLTALPGCSEDCPPCPSGGRILSVRADGTGRYETIQDAVDAALDEDVIELADGRFHGEGNRDIDLGGKAITLRSLSWRADACTLDCEGSEEDRRRAFHLQGGEQASTRIENITIVNGYADPDGGGILCDRQSSPTVNGVIFSGCVAPGHGGGICVKGGSGLLIKSCTFMGNSAGGGGGLSSTGGSPPTYFSAATP